MSEVVHRVAAAGGPTLCGAGRGAIGSDTCGSKDWSLVNCPACVGMVPERDRTHHFMPKSYLAEDGILCGNRLSVSVQPPHGGNLIHIKVPRSDAWDRVRCPDCLELQVVAEIHLP